MPSSNSNIGESSHLQLSSFRDASYPFYIFLFIPSSTIPSHPAALPAADSIEPRTFDFSGGALSLCAFGTSALVLELPHFNFYLCIPHLLHRLVLCILETLSTLILKSMYVSEQGDGKYYPENGRTAKGTTESLRRCFPLKNTTNNASFQLECTRKYSPAAFLHFGITAKDGARSQITYLASFIAQSVRQCSLEKL
jgi:hypothetical protein